MPSVTSPTTRFTAAEFERMCEAGIFGSRRVELINGRIYRMPAQLDPHMMSISKTNRALVAIVPETEWLVVQGTLRLDRNTTVDPDFMWLPVPLGTPNRQWPSPLLLIEISASTYRKDAGPKLRKFAKNGIRDYWIANLNADRVEIYRDPQNPTGKLRDCRYATVTHHARGETIALLARPEATFLVDDLLP